MKFLGEMESEDSRLTYLSVETDEYYNRAQEDMFG